MEQYFQKASPLKSLSTILPRAPKMTRRSHTPSPCVSAIIFTTLLSLTRLNLSKSGPKRKRSQLRMGLQSSQKNPRRSLKKRKRKRRVKRPKKLKRTKMPKCLH